MAFAPSANRLHAAGRTGNYLRRGKIPISRQHRMVLSRSCFFCFTWSFSLMRLLIALILPWLTFFTIGRPIAGIICLILQITLIGWIPATIWAVYALSQYKTDKKIEAALGGRK